MRRAAFWILIVGLAWPCDLAAQSETLTIPLAAAEWKALPADGVALALSKGDPEALRLAWDFQGRSGWAAAQTTLDAALPPNYEIRFDLRGEGPSNALEVKLLDGHGNVWWFVQRDVAWPRDAQGIKIKKRQVSFAWGPAGGGEIPRLAAIEFAVTAGRGGQGWIELANLSIVERPVPPREFPEISARASSEAAGGHHAAALAVDGDLTTAWRSLVRKDRVGTEELVLDLGVVREFGGITLRWADGVAPARVGLALSEDGLFWNPARVIERPSERPNDQENLARIGSDHWRLPESEARFVRISFEGEEATSVGVAEVLLRPLAFGDAQEMFATLALEAPRGVYPRGFRGEPSTWTVVGTENDPYEALFSVDGALEARDGGFSIEPSVALENRELLGWAQAQEITPALLDDELPIPRTTRTHRDFTLTIEPVATQLDGHSLLFARYRLTNRTAHRLRGQLLLAARPFQVNPPQQFLNRAGGLAPLSSLACSPSGVDIAGRLALRLSSLPSHCATQSFDDTHARPTLPSPTTQRSTVHDATSFASANLTWSFDLAPSASFEVMLGSPLSTEPDPLASPALEQTLTRQLGQGSAGFSRLLAAERNRWQRALGPLELDLPSSAADLSHSIRASLGHILIHRDGPAIQPGSRAYARSWIRDGALTGVALLRLGRADVARDFIEWFATFQYPDGKVPCCVDARGADPVPEHDSHGELIHLAAEVFRYTDDRAFGEGLFPAVARAVEAIETLRQSRRTDAEKSPERAKFWGLLPESISHEGYSTKPVHSYWDDTWALRGLDDAVDLARALGHDQLAEVWSARRDQFGQDFLASIDRVRAERNLDFLPASADLGDFDSTSTTVQLDPGGLLDRLPRAALGATFERYWQHVLKRRDETRRGIWAVYTPYEIRHVGAFVRWGERARAHELLAAFLVDQQPRGWRQWPEVVSRHPLAARFVGDLPHGWVGSDFLRSALDLFAYEDRAKRALVLAAGLDPTWLDRARGVAIHKLATPWGELGYRVRRRAKHVVFTFERGLATPPGGVIVHWPLAGRGGLARVNGRRVSPHADGTLHLPHLPRTIEWLPARNPEKNHHGDQE